MWQNGTEVVVLSSVTLFGCMGGCEYGYGLSASLQMAGLPSYCYFQLSVDSDHFVL